MLLPGKRARDTFLVVVTIKESLPILLCVVFSHHHAAERLVWGLAVNGGRQEVLKLVQSFSEEDDT